MSLALVPGGQSGAADTTPAGQQDLTRDQAAGLVMAHTFVVILTHIGQQCVLSYHLFPPPSLGLKHVTGLYVSSVFSSQCHLQCTGPKGDSRHSYSIPPTLTCSTDTTPFEGSASRDRVRKKGNMSFSSVKF